MLRLVMLITLLVVSSLYANVNFVCKAGIMDNQNAKRYINKLLLKEPENIECILKLADVHLKSGDLMQGYSLVTRAYNIDPHSVESSSIANVLPDALKMVRLQEKAQKENNYEFWNEIGDTFFSMGVAKEAANAYHKSLSLNNEQKEIALKLALSYERSGRSELALETLQNLIQKDATNFYGHYYLAKLLKHEFGKNHEAYEHFAKAKELLNSDAIELASSEKSRFEYDVNKEMEK